MVVATGSPFDSGLTLHFKLAAYNTYAIALDVKPGSVPAALYWDTEDPYHYVRVQPMGDHDVLIAGGEDHKTGQANDPAVRAVVMGIQIVGNASLYRTIGAKKPVFGTPSTPADYGTKNNFNLLGAGFSVLPAMAIFAATYLKAKNVAMVYADEPGGQAAAVLVKKFLDRYKVGLTKVPVPTNSTDLVGAITAAKAQSSDAFLAVVTAPLCTQIAKAQKQLGLKVPVVAVLLCGDASVAKALGDLPSWYYGLDTPSPFVPGDPQEDIFVAKVRQYGGADANLSGFAASPFAKLMTLVKWLNELGPNATPAQLTAKAKSFTGPQWQGGPTLKCGAVPTAPSVCNTSARIYEYHGNKKWTDSTKGKWIDIANPPAA